MEGRLHFASSNAPYNSRDLWSASKTSFENTQLRVGNGFWLQMKEKQLFESLSVFLQTECGRGLGVDLSECPTTSGVQFITANLFAFPLVLPISFLF